MSAFGPEGCSLTSVFTDATGSKQPELAPGFASVPMGITTVVATTRKFPKIKGTDKDPA